MQHINFMDSQEMQKCQKYKTNIKKMNLGDIKMYALNISSLVISISNVDVVLKIFLLLLSIGYTINKWVLLRDEKNK